MVDMSRGRIVFLVVLLTFFAATASANSGAPLFKFMLNTWFWLVLIPIILVEMLVAKRIIGVSTGHALAISVIANAVSTAIGVALAWYFPVANANPGTAAMTAAFLMIPAFFLSVFIERRIAYLLVPAEKRDAARQWSWRANLYTYEGMIVFLVAMTQYHRFMRS